MPVFFFFTGCNATTPRKYTSGITYGPKRKSINLGIPQSQPVEYPDLNNLESSPIVSRDVTLNSPAPSVVPDVTTPRDLISDP
jgi:hypothetical protein